MARTRLAETLLAQVPYGAEVTAVAFSADGRHVAWVQKHAGRAALWLDGKEQRIADHIRFLQFTPGGDVVCAISEKYRQGYWQDEFDAKPVWHLRCGDSEGRGFRDISSVVAGPKNRIAFAGEEKDGSKRIEADGELWKKYEKISRPVFNASGESLACVAEKNGVSCVLENNREGKKHDEIRYLMYAPHGEIAYTARKGSRWSLIIGDTEWAEYDYIGCPAFSPDGNLLAYKAREGNKEFVIFGGERGKACDTAGTYIFFSPDGKHIAWEARTGSKSRIVYKDKEGPAFDSVGEWITFSPDGTQLYYLATTGGQTKLTINGEGFAVCSDASKPVFSKDGKKWAVALRVGQEFWVVCGKKKSGPYKYVQHVQFSAGGGKLMYGAMHGRSLWWKSEEM